MALLLLACAVEGMALSFGAGLGVAGLVDLAGLAGLAALGPRLGPVSTPPARWLSRDLRLRAEGFG